MAIYSSILAQRIPLIEQPGRPQSMRLQSRTRTHTILSLSSVDRHLGCFHILSIVSNASVNIRMHAVFLISVFFFFPDLYQEVKLLGHMVVYNFSFLIFILKLLLHNFT